MTTHDDATHASAMHETLKLYRVTHRNYGSGGAWVQGQIAGHAFEALVFAAHAESESYELGDSRISKLWLQQDSSGRVVANFDRGWDVQPTTHAAKQIVDLLAAGLAETVFGK